MIYCKVAKKDIIALYNTSHPTLRRWFRRQGLGHFVGRRLFEVREVLLIFQTLGKPVLARKAALRVQELYYLYCGRPSPACSENPLLYKGQTAWGFDCLPTNAEERDSPSFLQSPSSSPLQSLRDALHRLLAVSIRLRADKLLGWLGRGPRVAQESEVEGGQRIEPIPEQELGQTFSWDCSAESEAPLL